MKKLLTKSGSGNLSITRDGYAFLDKATTDSHGDIYAFTGEGLSSTTAAAAMARLSRSPHDMRITILKEFAEQGKDEALLRRVITMYGDDSVQQLVGIHLAVENASNLLTKYIEWGRLAAYLEQSTRYIFYDEKDASDRYKYFVPDELSGKTRSAYQKAMDDIFDIYSSVVHKLYEYIAAQSSTPEDERDGAWKSAARAQACDAARPILPVATKSTVGIFGSSQAIESMIMRLRAHTNKEARDAGEEMLQQVRQVIPAFFDRADKPERGGGTSAYLATTSEATSKLGQKLVPDQPQSPQSMTSTLSAVHPRDELELAADVLYQTSNRSLEAIKGAVSQLSDEEKRTILKTYCGTRLNRRHRPGRAFENAHYTFDIVCDYGIFRDLQRHRIVDDLRWQHLTPDLGFDVPELVKDAGLEAEYNAAFDISAKLHSLLDDSAGHEIAQYATLLGHNMRWRITFNAREAFHLLELRTSPQGHPGYRKLCKMMYDQIAKVHPTIADEMIFINKDEDPELTRLAAERASQRKLDALES